MRTIRYILQKEFIQVFRNKTMLPIIFIVSIVQLLVLSYTAKFEIKNVNLFVLDQDNSSDSREIIAKFQGSPFYTIVGQSTNFDLGMEALIDDNAHQLLQIPEDFEKGLQNQKKARL